MKLKNLFPALALAAILCFSVSPASAQQSSSAPATGGAQQPTAPIGSTGSGSGPVPAARGVSNGDDANPYSVIQSEPDNHPLTSAESYSLGATSQAREIFDPSFFVIESGTVGAGTNNSTLSSSTQLNSITSVGGSLSASQLWSHYSLIASYNGIGNFYRGPNVLVPNTQSQSLGVSQVVDFGRWIVRVRDDFAYSPQTAFGDASFGGPGLIGQVGSTGVLGGLNSNFTTGESIQTGQADRISNTVLGEVDYSATRRSQFTLTGSYALLKFVQSGFINSHDVRGQIGYSFLLDPRNTIGLTASFDRTTYQTAGSIDESRFDLSLGRKVTGRLAMQVSGGESLIHFQDFSPSIGQRWIWDAAAGLTYSLRRNVYTLSYAHAAQDGSGVLLGSQTHLLTVSMVHHFSRFTSAGINGGYTKSSALLSSLNTASAFSGWYGGLNLSRQIGRHFSTTASYGAQRQTAGAGACPVAVCASSSIVHTFSVNVTWHPNAIQVQ